MPVQTKEQTSVLTMLLLAADQTGWSEVDLEHVVHWFRIQTAQQHYTVQECIDLAADILVDAAMPEGLSPVYACRKIFYWLSERRAA